MWPQFLSHSLVYHDVQKRWLPQFSRRSCTTWHAVVDQTTYTLVVGPSYASQPSSLAVSAWRSTPPSYLSPKYTAWAPAHEYTRNMWHPNVHHWMFCHSLTNSKQLSPNKFMQHLLVPILFFYNEFYLFIIICYQLYTVMSLFLFHWL